MYIFTQTKILSRYTLLGAVIVLASCGGDYKVPEINPTPVVTPTAAPEPTPLPNDPTPPVPIVNGDLEADDTAYTPWGQQGGINLAVDNTVAHGGNNSLLVTSRGDGWHGPTYSLTGLLADNLEYEFVAYVRLQSPASAEVAMTAKIEYEGGTAYVGIARETVTDSDWVELTGRLVMVNVTEETPITIYFESPEATASFYVDDFAGQQSMALELQNRGLEDSDTDVSPWITQGSPTIAVTDAQKNSGSYSLLVTGRDASWQGPAYKLLDILTLESETDYELSAFARMATPASDTVSMSYKNVVTGSDAEYGNIGSATVTDAEWSELYGEFTTGDLENLDELITYFEASDPAASYYIDDLRVAKLLPNMITNGDLETSADSVDPWFAQGSPNLSINTDTVYRGSNSLLVADRDANWQGAAYRLLGTVESNKNYLVRAWVRMQSPASEEIKISYKLTLAEDSYGAVASVMATDGEWTQISGTLSTEDLTDATELMIYFESPSDTASYFIDNLRVSELK